MFAGKGQDADQGFLVAQGVGGGGGHDGDAGAAGDHVADGFEGAAFERVLQGAGAGEVGAGFQHLIAEAVALAEQQEILAVEFVGLDVAAPDPGVASQDGDAGNLAKVDPGEKVRADEVMVKANETKPPPRYSEATLLSAMEGAGKMVDDEELKAAMAGRGLGTPATRAQIIENLIGEQYMHREGRELIPTAKAFSLMTLLNGLGINELTQPELTGEWEWKLGRIEKGEFTREEFMREIAEMTRHLVERAKTFDSDTRLSP